MAMAVAVRREPFRHLWKDEEETSWNTLELALRPARPLGPVELRVLAVKDNRAVVAQRFHRPGDEPLRGTECLRPGALPPPPPAAAAAEPAPAPALEDAPREIFHVAELTVHAADPSLLLLRVRALRSTPVGRSPFCLFEVHVGPPGGALEAMCRSEQVRLLSRQRTVSKLERPNRCPEYYKYMKTIRTIYRSGEPPPEIDPGLTDIIEQATPSKRRNPPLQSPALDALKRPRSDRAQSIDGLEPRCENTPLPRPTALSEPADLRGSRPPPLCLPPSGCKALHQASRSLRPGHAQALGWGGQRLPADRWRGPGAHRIVAEGAAARSHGGAAGQRSSVSPSHDYHDTGASQWRWPSDSPPAAAAGHRPPSARGTAAHQPAAVAGPHAAHNAHAVHAGGGGRVVQKRYSWEDCASRYSTHPLRDDFSPSPTPTGAPAVPEHARWRPAMRWFSEDGPVLARTGALDSSSTPTSEWPSLEVGGADRAEDMGALGTPCNAESAASTSSLAKQPESSSRHRSWTWDRKRNGGGPIEQTSTLAQSQTDDVDQDLFGVVGNVGPNRDPHCDHPARDAVAHDVDSDDENRCILSNEMADALSPALSPMHATSCFPSFDGRERPATDSHAPGYGRGPEEDTGEPWSFMPTESNNYPQALEHQQFATECDTSTGAEVVFPAGMACQTADAAMHAKSAVHHASDWPL